MANLWLFGCLFNRHAPIRRDVIWDGATYNGKCRNCGKAVFRNGRQDWRERKGAPETDAEA